MNRILLSAVIIAAVAAVGVYGTTAFFSDTETSAGNTISAGSIDLKIDNDSYLNNVPNPGTSWALSDLSSSTLFFNFANIQPQTFGEDTISLHSTDPAYACMKVTKTMDADVTCTDPENEAELGLCDASSTTAGELGSQLNFYFWGDDGDNVFESDEATIPTLSGSAATIFDGTWKRLADSTGEELYGTSTTLPAGTAAYIAKYWCYGTAATVPVAQDGLTTEGPDSGTPIRGSGFTCDGVSATNSSQTDKLMADVSFYGVQSANNGSFVCSSL